MPDVTRSACLLVPDTTYQTRSPSEPVRICVIDLGTNSFHAVIVDAYPNGSYKVVDRMKEMVRLGQSGLANNQLPEDAMQRGLKALQRIHLLARGWDVREYLAYATSAIREARNGGQFIERIKRDVGLRIRAISGEQEAELIYLGVRRAVALARRPVALRAVGGIERRALVGLGHGDLLDTGREAEDGDKWQQACRHGGPSRMRCRG